MVRDAATCNISLQEVEGSSANRDTKKDYSKRFSNHHKELTKMMQKLDVAVAADDHVLCTTLLNDSEQMVLALGETWKAWKKVKQAALL